MEGAPKIPSPNNKEDEKKNAAEKMRRARAIVGAAVGASLAAASPVSKAMATPEMPLATEKLVVRPEDMNKEALKDEIKAYSAKFELNKDGEIKRIAGDKK